ncbi:MULTISPECIES: hypothetical protein [unclassified Streptomyces]|jgi:hypothetical protein|uniref:Secreted protein n=1 Tax=Streptomyces sp. R08 TaxID=3238624 RepID=A0AB39M4E6_9ACTN|nr:MULTISPECIES: hypothetical protein [unclassified Streptomyces]MCX4815388.1 hypothetical protein [Streptomyces sp. NBC_01239]UXX96462.1 hypothetical protein N7U49_40480 [Streptomyces sp. AD2-2]
MKKRSMLAIASLATGFVVAAITPSHSHDHDVLGDLNVKDTVGAMDHLVSDGSFAADEGVLGQNT